MAGLRGARGAAREFFPQVSVERAASLEVMASVPIRGVEIAVGGAILEDVDVMISMRRKKEWRRKLL